MSQETALDGEDDILLSGGSVIMRCSMKGEGTGSYGWNMEELANNALEVQRCLRSPLARGMFPSADVAEILAHPIGQRLRPSRC